MNNTSYAKLKNFISYIKENETDLKKPHSSIPKDILKGLLVFLASVFFIVPGVIAYKRLFSENRPTTTGEQIVEPVNEFSLPRNST